MPSDTGQAPRPITTPFGISAPIEPAAAIDLLRETSLISGVPLDVDTRETKHAGRSLVGGRDVRRASSRPLTRESQPLRVAASSSFGSRRSCVYMDGLSPVVAGEYLHVPHLEVEDGALHVPEVALHQARVEDHHEEGEAHGADGDESAAPVSPHVPPGHFEDPQAASSLTLSRGANASPTSAAEEKVGVPPGVVRA